MDSPLTPAVHPADPGTNECLGLVKTAGKFDIDPSNNELREECNKGIF